MAFVAGPALVLGVGVIRFIACLPLWTIEWEWQQQFITSCRPAPHGLHHVIRLTVVRCWWCLLSTDGVFAVL
jgi:hypothetical protein